MIKGSCHCGAIRFVLADRPQWLMRCNCTYCRRAGGLWAHAPMNRITLNYDPEAVVRYVWGDRTLAHVSCRTCGCITHWESLDPQPGARMAVNCSMAEPDAIAGLRIRHFDGADSWAFLD